MRTFICIVRNINRICVSKSQNVPHDVEHWNIRLLEVPSILAFSPCEYLVFTLLKNLQKYTRVFVSIFAIQIHSESIDPLFLFFFLFSNAVYTHERLALSFPRIDCIRKRYACIDQRRSILATQFNFHNGCIYDSFWFSSVFIRFQIPICAFQRSIFLRFLHI